ncbi:MAG: GC-type dockerin domain-anchored protein, partial [Planctomycetota bacterium]
FAVSGGGSMAYEPQSGMLAIKLNDDLDTEILFADPDSGAAMPPVAVTGLPAGLENTAGIGYSGVPGALVFTIGPSGTFFEDRLALVGADGAVQQVSIDLGIGDNDGAVWDEHNARLVVTDYNAVDGFAPLIAVNEPFSVPQLTAIATPPFNNDIGDSAIHPDDGRVFAVGFGVGNGFLIEVAGNSYIDVGAFGTASQVLGIAFVPGACAADTNGDGVVTPADFNAWVIAFNSNAPACDQNADGLCTPADFNAWVLNFNAGC